MEKIKYFFKKENFRKIKLLVVAIISVILAVIFEYGFYTKYIDNNYDSKTRMLLIAMAFFFVRSSFCIQIK